MTPELTALADQPHAHCVQDFDLVKALKTSGAF